MIEAASPAEATAPQRDRMWGLTDLLVSVADTDLTLRDVNAAWPALLGWSQSEIAGRAYTDFVHPDDRDDALEAAASLAAGRGAADLENRFCCKDGSYRWIAWSLTAEGGACHCVGRDTTEQKAQAAALVQVQDALRQARKMEAVGQLAGGIAHDFNNMLGVVIGSLDLLKRRVSLEDPRAIRYVEAASDGARRAAQLTQRLLAFSRQQPLRSEAIDANALVAGMSALIGGAVGSAIRLQTVLAPDLWSTRADANLLESVLLNLAVNARDAMADGGRLIIETRNADLRDGDLAEALEVSAGQYVLITVTDTGSGMSQAVMDRAFEPFFTTKAIGKGTGLGLSQVLDFANQSGGYVRLCSELGLGTAVKLYLPRLCEAATAPSQMVNGHGVA